MNYIKIKPEHNYFFFDSYLYKALAEADQLDIIPVSEGWRVEAGRKGGKAKPLSLFDIEAIVSAVERYNGSTNEVARHLRYSTWRVRKVCKELGIETMGSGNWRKSTRF